MNRYIKSLVCCVLTSVFLAACGDAEIYYEKETDGVGVIDESEIDIGNDEWVEFDDIESSDRGDLSSSSEENSSSSSSIQYSSSETNTSSPVQSSSSETNTSSSVQSSSETNTSSSVQSSSSEANTSSSVQSSSSEETSSPETIWNGIKIDAGSEYDASKNTLKDLRDGRVYKTVSIGSQIWMAENLNLAYLQSTLTLDSSSFCYGNLKENCDTYGRLYLWSAAVDSAAIFSTISKGVGYGTTMSASEKNSSTFVRGVCPSEWHLPSQEDFQTLYDYVNAYNGNEGVGKSLKSQSTWNSGYQGSDAFNFNALASGRYSMDVDEYQYTGLGNSAYFLTSSESELYPSEFYEQRYLSTDDRVHFVGYRKTGTGSIRCVKDVGGPAIFINTRWTPSNVDAGSEYNAANNTLKDLRDNQTYRTVTIGTQTWMAENLNYAYLQQTTSVDSSSFCYNNSADNCNTYGRLYLWSAAMDSAAIFSEDGKNCGYAKFCNVVGSVRGACPKDWHLPSKEEWKTLYDYVDFNKDGEYVGAELMGETTWKNAAVEATDSFGFGILAAGGYVDYSFSGLGSVADIWTSSESDMSFAYRQTMYNFKSDLFEQIMGKYYAYAVRCVRDE